MTSVPQIWDLFSTYIALAFLVVGLLVLNLFMPMGPAMPLSPIEDILGPLPDPVKMLGILTGIGTTAIGLSMGLVEGGPHRERNA